MKRKKSIFVFIILVLIIILVLCIYLYQTTNYSLEAIKKRLYSNETKLNNVHISYKNSEDEIVTNEEIFIKDNNYYVVSKDKSDIILSEYFYSFEESKLTLVNHQNKTILEFSNKTPNVLNGVLLQQEFLWNSNTLEYNYIGKEIINDEQCVKVNFTENNYDKIQEYIYYVNLTNNEIIKLEIFEGTNINDLKKQKEIMCTYSYNTVTPDDIKKFDINNYSGYSFTQMTNA